jgi:hypothetical protein
MTNYLVATFRDRIQAEAAYTTLETAGLPLSQVSILGQGYKSLEESGVFDPHQAARQQAWQMMLWLIPFGFFAGFTFNQVTQLTILSSLNELGNSLLGGLMGAAAGALGSFTVGGGLQLLIRQQDAVPYRDRLQAGKYLLVVTGSDLVIRQANNLLQSLGSEGLQVYEAPDRNPTI